VAALALASGELRIMLQLFRTNVVAEASDTISDTNRTLQKE
jgi:hypothetical protein